MRETRAVLEGRCRCGGVRYRTGHEPFFEVICCCDDCQRMTGTGHLPAIGVPRTGFEVEGEPRSYTSATSMGTTSVFFCVTCGAPLFGSLENFPQFMWIFAGSLERPKPFSPTVAVHVGKKCAWDVLPGRLHLWRGRFGDTAAASMDAESCDEDGDDT